MQQSTLVAAIVVITFALGFMSGRATAPQGSAAPAPIAVAPPAPAQTPFPTTQAAAPPMAAPAAAPGDSPSGVAGTLAEVIQVPNYTYLRIATPHGDEWAAVSSDASLAVGQRVALGHANRMENFASKTLNRTFDAIWFGELAR